MNPTALLHQPSTFDVPLSSIGHDRSYSNLHSFATNEYVYPPRRPQPSLTNPTFGPPLSNTSLDYNTQPPLTDGPGPSHQHTNGVLSPPDSLIGAISAISSSTSPFSYTTLPRPNLSNASAQDPFAGASGAMSNWADPMMNGFERHRIGPIPPPLTPPGTFVTGGSMPGAGHLLPRSVMDRSFPLYHSHPGMAHTYPNNMRPNLFGPRYTTYPQHDYGHYPNAPISHPEPAKPEGPPFGKTVVHHEVFSRSNQELKLEISASIQKGFFQVDNKWTCYRRNYFTVACSFSFKPPYADNSFYISSHSKLRTIEHFAVSISAKTACANNQESESRGLVQHTPKRDKATEKTPEKQYILPAPPISAHSHGVMNGLGGLMPNGGSSLMHGYTNFESAGQHSIPTSYTFERIQFQKATANNGKRRAQQQYFHIVVELSAYIPHPHDSEHWVVLATKESEPMVVRGRSPGHYKDDKNRRNSQTSVDRDHNGGGSDGSSGSYGGYMSHPHSSNSMDWGGRHGGHNGHHYDGSGTTYQSCSASEHSPVSAASSTTLTESPTETELAMSEVDTLKSPVYSFEHSALTSRPDGLEESLFGLSRSPLSRKRPLEDESADEGPPYHCNSPFCDTMSSNPFEFPGLTQATALCASS